MSDFQSFSADHYGFAENCGPYTVSTLGFSWKGRHFVLGTFYIGPHGNESAIEDWKFVLDMLQQIEKGLKGE